MTPERKVREADRQAGKRLTYIRAKRGYKDAADFARSHNIKEVTYRAHERGDGLSKHIENYARLLQTTANFLRYGEGSEDLAPNALDGNKDSPKSSSDFGSLVRKAPISAPPVGNLPVMGLASGGPEDADFCLSGEVADYLRRPPALEHSLHAYAIYAVGTSMVPRFEEGEPVFVNPARPARIGDYVLVELHAKSDGGPGPAYLKRLVKRTSDYIELEQFQPAKTFKIESKLVNSIHKVMLPADLFLA